MREIQVLDKTTIDKIAAGEVVERPASVIKELTENAIDANATAITIEIRDGGTTFMRITDNGAGIPVDQVKRAFLRHATSKIRKAEDLVTISSLGFRGEALSSIAAVSQMECITKTPEALTGVRYCIEGGEEKEFEEIGAPTGTTFLVRNLFFNVPARAKFLKSATAEANQVSNFVEQLALSHPDISFKFIVNGQNRLYTSGNGNLKEIVYQIFGRDLTREMIPISSEGLLKIEGFIGSPNVARGNRNFENYFVNGRYVKSKLLAKAIEDAYHGFLMNHKYPFTLLYITIDTTKVDVNVHPQKMELRFSDQEEIYHQLCLAIQNALMHREHIPEVSMHEQEKRKRSEAARLPFLPKGAPEPFERLRRSDGMPLKPDRNADLIKRDTSYRAPRVSPPPSYSQTASILRESSRYAAGNGSAGGTDSRPVSSGTTYAAQEKNGSASFTQEADKPLSASSVSPEQTGFSGTAAGQNTERTENAAGQNTERTENAAGQNTERTENAAGQNTERTENAAEQNIERSEIETADKTDTSLQETQLPNPAEMTQLSFLKEDAVLAEQSRTMFRIIGQVFDTYVMVEYKEALYIIDQHAAHEKVNYERMMKNFREKKVLSQNLFPAIILDLSTREAELVQKHLSIFAGLGYEIEHFGGKTWKVSAVPTNLYSVASRRLLIEIIDQLDELGELSPAVITQKLASMSCKAAVKGNNQLSRVEMEALIAELLTLDDPYHCPHGRPTIVSMSHYELDKKFKRIL